MQIPPFLHANSAHTTLCISSAAETAASCSNQTMAEFACKFRHTGGICMQEWQNLHGGTMGFYMEGKFI